MIVHSDPQGSEPWLEARRGVITASRFKDARDRKSPTAAQKKEGITRGEPSDKMLGYAKDVAREIFGGRVPAPYVNAAMRTGQAEEAPGRAEYEIETGLLVELAGFITTDDRAFGVSVDGFVGDDGIIEIKTMVSSNTLFKALVEGDMSDYVDQCNGAMWLLGRKWVDLVFWAPDIAEAGGRGLRIQRIHRDDNVIDELERDLLQFKSLVGGYLAKLRAFASANAPQFAVAA